MKKFAAFLLCVLMALSVVATAFAAVPDADAKLIESLGKKASDYVALDWFAEMNAYYNTSSSTLYNVVTSKANSTASNLANFIVSKQFTQKELPIGSIIIVDAGYQYRPEGWTSADLPKNTSATRPANVTTNVVEVTKEWWGNWAVRAFNLSVTPTRAITEADKAALRIYVPTTPAENNIYSIDFESKEGDLKASVDSYNFYAYPGNGKTTVVEFQGDKALYLNHTAAEKANSTYVQLFYNEAEGIAKFGCPNQFVVEYEVFFEKTHADMIFALSTMGCKDAAGAVAWVEPYFVKGENLGLYASNNSKTALRNLKLNTWYKISVAVDLEKQITSLYIDDEVVVKDLAFNKKIEGTYAKQFRFGFAKNNVNEFTAYIDSVKAYGATQPRVVKDAAPAETTKAPATTTKAPATTTKAPAATTKPAATPAAPQTFDAGILVATVAAVSLAGTVVLKKKR